MNFFLAKAIQREFVVNPPTGWNCREEAQLLDPDLRRLLGYEPAVDLVFENRDH